MNRARDSISSWGSALCIVGAAILAVFFHGDDIRWLVGAQLLLLCWLAFALAQSYGPGLRIPLTPISLSLSLFWLWLAVSLAWSRVPVTSTINFWWVGTFVMVYWSYTLAPMRAHIWAYASPLVLAGAIALCVWALVQLFVFQQPPRASFINIHSFGALLMLVALPTAGYLLVALAGGRRHAAMGSAAALFLLFFTIALTRGRGTSSALWLATGLLIALHVRHAAPRHLMWLGGLLAAAYISANLLLLGELGERLASLVDPVDAASPRLLIWRGAWDMVRDYPWWGIGLGTYYLAWPPYRDPSDQTLGFYVHNDYLQIWIETGLPGVLLLVSVLLGTLFMVARYLRQRQLDRDQRTETIALCSGLFAIAAHSFLDFNLYTLSISLLVGLALGRLHELVSNALAGTALVLCPAPHLRQPLYRFAVLAVIAGPAVYLAAVGLSDHYFARGLAHGMRGEFQQADRAIRAAQQLAPASNKLLAYADLLRIALRAVPKESMADRRALYDEALAWLDGSLRANPYQALSHVVRARLYEEQPDLVAGDWRALAAAEYRRALELNPRLYTVRVYWAELLLGTNQTEKARDVLENGMAHWYAETPPVIAYYELTARLRRASGDGEGAGMLDQRVEAIRAVLAKRELHLPPAPTRGGALLQSLAQ